ncbi:MAG: ptsI [Bacilli bacterium]|nr:ptsI [Bacilli bacterium]
MNSRVGFSIAFSGLPVSNGVAIAPAYVLFTHSMRFGGTFLDPAHSAGGVCDVQTEIESFESAVRQTILYLQETRRRLPPHSEAASIIETHEYMVCDPLLREGVVRRIEQGSPAGTSMWEELTEWAQQFQTLEDEYMRSRAVDLLDVRDRLLTSMLGTSHDLITSLEGPVILVAEELTPTVAVELNPDIIKGIVMARGGETSHGAILARSSGIPAISGMGDKWFEIQSGDLIAMDGSLGKGIIRPSANDCVIWQKKVDESNRNLAELELWKQREARTAEGTRVHVAVNIGTPDEAQRTLDLGPDGVGLFRTEFMFVNRTSWPTEDEQVAAYSEVARQYGDRTVILRTMDAGGDKVLPFFQSGEQNPFLGYRAVRVSLGQPKEFLTQLRAMYRAAKMGNVWIMVPMIQSLDEWREVKKFADLARKQVQGPDVPLGMMMETPAAALLADLFLQEADFCSIGTNDLTQYTLAVDRMNEQVSDLYNPFHPAVLRLVSSIIESAKRHNKWVGVCGEFAGDLRAIPWLIAQEVDEISMSASRILAAKRRISEITLSEWKLKVDQLLQFRTAKEVIDFLEKQN